MATERPGPNGRSEMDEVFFSYVTNVLEDLGSPKSVEENFDMEAFVEMMEAHIPGFAEINSGNVYGMMFSLSERLCEARSKQITSPTPVQNRSWVPSEAQTTTEEEGAGTTEEDQLSYSSVGEALAQDPQGELVDAVDMVLEMFPACTVSKATKVLGMALGNLEEAVQFLLEEEPLGMAGTTTMQEASRPGKSCKQDECKQFILQKYMMVDSEEDQKTHKPAPPKEAPKKLIRYIDNQVVSTKGERYKDLRKPEGEEMKKTYINLKPARKYKFH
ncbi:CUE domain-containing protein 2 isoform X2 [Sphaerodactylus townsendi]|uniref:CUE domain-containing protein 2 isoform X2 n=1 Tax=Sphaerodactylus townsendi TaxID=933632 RepID=UPI002026846A|nr:CUE domain-containing protein 2 isoform X2 [Sphaerodactylus townsendi]